MALFNRYLTGLALVAVVLAVGVVMAATPDPDGAILTTKWWNECPNAIVTTTNLYPDLISIRDDITPYSCSGWVNCHLWRLSAAGTVPYFDNDSAFTFSATIVIHGRARVGLQIAPWWDQSEGFFGCNTDVSGMEIFAFGGCLPYYNFTVSQGIAYSADTPITLSMTYLPNGLSAESPATIKYTVEYLGVTYSSPALPFTKGSQTLEDEVMYGSWGMLNRGRIGGCMFSYWNNPPLYDPSYTKIATFTDIAFRNLDGYVADVARDEVGVTPSAPALEQVHPNPFNPSTTITFALPQAQRIRLDIMDAAGRHVTTLADEEQSAGRHEVVWDGTADGGRAVPSGVYFARLETPTGLRSVKITLAR